MEPHDLELTPDQIEAIDTADVVLYLGGGFQPAVEDAIGDAAGRAIDVSGPSGRSPFPTARAMRGLTADPHVWLDPALYEQVVEQVRAALAEADRTTRRRSPRTPGPSRSGSRRSTATIAPDWRSGARKGS